MSTRLIIIFSVLFNILSVSWTDAQETRIVKGIVTVFKKIPLNKVRIFDAKSKSVVYTDSTGMFSIGCFDKDMLNVYASGFLKKNIKVQKDAFYNIDLIYIDNPSNFNDAVSNGHIREDVLRKALISMSSEAQKDYSKYKSIYELIASEFSSLRVNGTSVVNTKRRSFGSQQVLFVVNNRIVQDISYVIPDDVKTIEFLDDVSASLYGSMGANGVLKITLK